MFTGSDIVEGDSEDENMKEFESLLSSIKTRFGVYGVLGASGMNHREIGDSGSQFKA